MGVYIKGMDMPKHCHDCEFFLYEWGDDCEPDVTCRLTEEELTGPKEKGKRCPLTEVPEPHGRLIDADACIDYIRNNNQQAWEALAYAPTVIERSNNE